MLYSWFVQWPNGMAQSRPLYTIHMVGFTTTLMLSQSPTLHTITNDPKQPLGGWQIISRDHYCGISSSILLKDCYMCKATYIV